MKIGRGGFTLTELIIASALASMVILMGTAFFIDSHKEEQVMRQTASLSWNTMVLSRVLGKVLKDAGGASIRPWNSIRVEDNCAAWITVGLPNCDGSDRITIAVEKTNPSDEYYPRITTQNYDLGTGTLQIFAVDGDGDGTFNSSECSIDASMFNSSAVIVNSSEAITRTLRILSVDIPTCRMTVEPDLQGEVIEQGTLGSEVFLNGTLSLVTLKTIYWDSSTKKLVKLSKIANTNVLAAEDLHYYSDNIYDLQFALGYDVGFRNQTITINGTATDEVLYNVAGETLGTLGGVGGVKTDLKMLFVSIVAGTSQYKKSALGNSVSILNGTAKADIDLYLYSVERRFYLRNVLDFL